MTLSPYISRVLRASLRDLIASVYDAEEIIYGTNEAEDKPITLLPSVNIPADELEDLLIHAWEQSESLGYTIRRLRRDNPIAFARLDLIDSARRAAEQVTSTCAELALELEAEMVSRAKKGEEA